MSAENALEIAWSGCWEKRQDRDICRWTICWVSFGSYIVGAIGGYSGGGSFQLEKFSVMQDEKIITSAYDDLSDELSCDDITICEDCVDKVLSFHSKKIWEDSDALYLKKGIKKTLVGKEDLLFGGSKDIEKSLMPLFEIIGLISSPIT